jgi:hypothetical protein
MINVYLDSEMRFTAPCNVSEINQYSSYTLTVELSGVEPQNKILLCNIVRPDGIKSNPLYMSYVQPDI